MSINKSLKNAMLTNGGLLPYSDNTPTQYDSRQRQYFSPETKTFTQTMAKYSSDYVEALVQGIDPEHPYDWQTRLIRFADVVRPSAAILRKADNFKMLLFADRDIEYVMPGSKVVTMGSTWLVANPFNISGSDGKAIVERCNAVWNYYDYYGNVISEPLVIMNARADANDSDAQEGNLITKGYFNAVMQCNDATRQIDTNTRFILGTAAYRVTGYADFLQEFTGDYNSVRILEFALRYEEPNYQIDDMVNHVAGGKNFSWKIEVAGATTLSVGQTAQFSASSVRNGEGVGDTPENPISYKWTSSDESVASVDAFGAVTALAEGKAVITATLVQNEAQGANIAVTVAAAEGGRAVRFTTAIPTTLNAYEDCEIGAALFENGSETDEAIEWSFDGAADGTYSAMTNGKTTTVYCFGYSGTPLTVTARCGEYSASAEIGLRGF